MQGAKLLRTGRSVFKSSATSAFEVIARYDIQMAMKALRPATPRRPGSWMRSAFTWALRETEGANRPIPSFRASGSDWTKAPGLGVISLDMAVSSDAAAVHLKTVRDRAARAKEREIAAHLRAVLLHDAAAQAQERLDHPDVAEAARERAARARANVVLAVREKLQAAAHIRRADSN